jgi:hypothetical protein
LFHRVVCGSIIELIKENEMKAGTRVRIVSIHKDDAYYHSRVGLIGLCGTITEWNFKHADKRHHACHVKVDTEMAHNHSFFKVKLERI